MKPLGVAIVIGVTCGSIAAYAAQRTIVQKDKAFSEAEVTIKAGDEIVFTNEDSIPHNILSNSAGNAFNLGLQQPGSGVTYAFKSPGEVEIGCGIHPRMKLKVTVTN
ncbi:MAG TPA: plastocyanin/azurin family copper-binding protein [Bradyrhizobium sp.]|nr:plastocyanin/azurin family copper-binding protein [Bradyrhizobium sp.]